MLIGNRLQNRAITFTILLLVFIIFIYVGFEISKNTVSVVKEERLLPRWDESTHAVEGWYAYHYLKHLNIPLFIWHLWARSYWPFVQPLYLTPFYFILGSSYHSALMGSIAAFVALGLLCSFLLILLHKNMPVLAISVTLFLLITSPLYLGYASLSMLEMFGSLVQVFVFITYVLSRQKGAEKKGKYAKLFAISLTILFFTKFNYFLLFIIPTLIHEYFTFTKNWRPRDHFKAWIKAGKWLLSSITGKIVAIFCIFMVIIYKAGGLEFYIFNQKISIHTPGAAGYIILYILLLKLWFLHRKKKIDREKIFHLDARIRPLVIFLGIPLLVWFAVPYPNHIADFFGPLLTTGGKTEGLNFFTGIFHYIKILRTDYFPSGAVFFLGLLIYLISVVRYKRQDTFTKWLILIPPIHILLAALHPLKHPRYIFLSLIPLILVIALELNHWFSQHLILKYTAGALSILIVCAGFISFHGILQTRPFKHTALGTYTQNARLNEALAWLRRHINAEDRLAILGKCDSLSPALFEWQLGPPRKYKYFIGVVGPKRYPELQKASHICLIVPTAKHSDPEILQQYNAHFNQVNSLLQHNRVVYIDEFEIDSLKLTFRLYKLYTYPGQDFDRQIFEKTFQVLDLYK
jgi:hypothetical protein